MSTVVLGTILSLAISFLLSARTSARHAVCSANMRSVAILHLDHASSNGDRFLNAGPDEHILTAPTQDTYRVGNTRGLPNGAWALLFPDEWVGPRFSKSLRCSRDPTWNPGAAGMSYALPAFWMSSALWLDPSSLRAPAPPDTPRWRENRVGDVAFPSRKVFLYEQVAFCLADPNASADILNAHTPNWPSSVSFVDGSVRRTARSSGAPGYFSLPFDSTVNGVLGFDVP